VDELPTEQADRALALQEILVAMATGGSGIDPDYRLLRKEFMERPDTAKLLPQFVRACRTLATFWEWIKGQAPTYAERRIIIRQAFASLLDHLERGGAGPADGSISKVLESFDEPGVPRRGPRRWIAGLMIRRERSPSQGPCSKRCASPYRTHRAYQPTATVMISRSSTNRLPNS
jgi:hypothetical protein